MLKSEYLKYFWILIIKLHHKQCVSLFCFEQISKTEILSVLLYYNTL